MVNTHIPIITNLYNIPIEVKSPENNRTEQDTAIVMRIIFSTILKISLIILFISIIFISNS